MSLLNTERSSLTTGYLFRWTLPLSLTFLMMAGSAPIVSTGITWMHGALGERLHLSAFLMTFALSLFFYSPMFMARNVAIRTVIDRRSTWQYCKFMVTTAAVSSFILALVSYVDLVGDFVFTTMLRADAEAGMLARHGLIPFVPLPIIIALRGLGQGCHINNHDNWHVGFGTALRMTTMAAFVFGIGIHTELTGPMLGGLAYLTGIGAETVYVLFTLRNKRQFREVSDETPLTFLQYTRYAGPLMVGSAFNQLLGPLLIYMIYISKEPGDNAATFSLLRDTGWVLFSMLMSVQPLIVAHATSRANLKAIVRFMSVFAGGLSILTLLIGTTSIKEAIFISWLEVDNTTIQRLAFVALFWLVPMPFVNAMNRGTAALHMRSGHTMWVTVANGLGLVSLWVASLLIDLSAFDGAIVAVMGNALYNLVAAAVQTLGLFGGGLTAAIAPESLSERMNRKAPAFEVIAEPSIDRG